MKDKIIISTSKDGINHIYVPKGMEDKIEFLICDYDYYKSQGLHINNATKHVMKLIGKDREVADITIDGEPN